MDNEQILLNLYKQQQVDVSRQRLQKLFMAVSGIGGTIVFVVMLFYQVTFLYVLAFGSTVLFVAVATLLVYYKRIKLNMACYFTTIYSAVVFVPAFWILTGITGSAPYVSLIILIGIVTLYSGRMLKWLLTGFLLILAGLVLYSALIGFPATVDVINLIYNIIAFASAVALTVLYVLYKQKEFNELNDKFLRSSFRDELTQLYNRKLLDLIIEYQETLYRRENKDYILVMFDVDAFKKMNDEHGHVFGDIILRTAAQCVQEKARSSDFVVRYGGDEFLVIQANASDASIKAFICRIETAMETACDLDIPLSISYGFAARSECATPNAVLHLADQRLYEKKEAKKVER